jgi:hypothetical protein
MPVSRTVPEHGSGVVPVAVAASAITASDAYRNICFIGVILCGFALGCLSFAILFPEIQDEVPENLSRRLNFLRHELHE